MCVSAKCLGRPARKLKELRQSQWTHPQRKGDRFVITLFDSASVFIAASAHASKKYDVAVRSLWKNMEGDEISIAFGLTLSKITDSTRLGG